MSNHEHDHHIMPFATNLKVFLALVGFTIFTVYTAKFHHFGRYGNIILAMFIASCKGSLVLLYFMHLKGDNRTNKVIIGSTVFFLFLLFSITFSDVFFR